MRYLLALITGLLAFSVAGPDAHKVDAILSRLRHSDTQPAATAAPLPTPADPSGAGATPTEAPPPVANAISGMPPECAAPPPWALMDTALACMAFYPPPFLEPIPYCRTGYTTALDAVCYGYFQDGTVYAFPSPPPGGWPTVTPPAP